MTIAHTMPVTAPIGPTVAPINRQSTFASERKSVTTIAGAIKKFAASAFPLLKKFALSAVLPIGFAAAESWKTYKILKNPIARGAGPALHAKDAANWVTSAGSILLAIFGIVGAALGVAAVANPYGLIAACALLATGALLYGVARIVGHMLAASGERDIENIRKDSVAKFALERKKTSQNLQFPATPTRAPVTRRSNNSMSPSLQVPLMMEGSRTTTNTTGPTVNREAATLRNIELTPPHRSQTRLELPGTLRLANEPASASAAQNDYDPSRI